MPPYSTDPLGTLGRHRNSTDKTAQSDPEAKAKRTNGPGQGGRLVTGVPEVFDEEVNPGKGGTFYFNKKILSQVSE